MSTNIFEKRKKDILEKKDKSSKGKWDEKIISLCEKINSKKEFYTTSSCSGRVLALIDFDKKVSNLFLYVSHDKIEFDEFKKELINLCTSKIPPTNPPTTHPKSSNLKTFKLLQMVNNNSVSKNPNKTIIFKQEPCGLHVACQTLEKAQELLTKAKLSGWKKSGIISSEKRFIVEMFGTGKLEFPIIKNGKLLVDDGFLKIVLKKANENLEKSWKIIEKLKNKI
ncbi:MAG: tRNA wybutosine-synthesizing 3 family protein [Candidatus Pacearchaeota archaeon]|jgi:tRNA wybutosine-synthesizing protein 3